MAQNQPDYFAKTLKSCATFLARWKGASASMWELTSSHKTLAVLMTRNGIEAGNLLIACLDPLYLKGPIRWEASDILVSKVRLPDGREDGFSVRDAGAGVEILCGAIEIKENVKLP